MYDERNFHFRSTTCNRFSYTISKCFKNKRLFLCIIHTATQLGIVDYRISIYLFESSIQQWHDLKPNLFKWSNGGLKLILGTDWICRIVALLHVEPHNCCNHKYWSSFSTMNSARYVCGVKWWMRQKSFLKTRDECNIQY